MYNMLDYIRSIVDKNIIELDNGYSQYTLNNYFSKFKNCIHIINAISKLNLTNNQHYTYLLDTIPRGWQKKIEYPKLTENKQQLINVIMHHYNVNEIIAKEYLNLMDKNEQKILKEMYLDV